MAKIEFVQCTHCGTVFPADYFNEWGKKYGIGLGSSPCCEALSSKYEMVPVWPAGQPGAAMHPVGVCKGTVIPVMLDEATETAVTAVDDPFYQKRVTIMQAIQVKKSPELRLHFAKLNT
jgi:hypothetical protein